jgi:uncharacterized protein (TIGR02996 family)
LRFNDSRRARFEYHFVTMSDQDALLAAIIANPDDDTPRLMYADWLDENLPDKTPSPAPGPSARAEFIRVQCRLAGHPFNEPDYPELLEREEDLGAWLNTHAPGSDTELDLPDDLEWFGDFGDGSYVRGFPYQVEYDDYDDDPTVNVERILEALPLAFARNTIRSLQLEDAYGDEILGLLRSPVSAGLRGLVLIDIEDDHDASSIAAIASSPHLTNLRRLTLDYPLEDEDFRKLAKAKLDSLERLALDYPSPAGLKALSNARWFRKLRSLWLWLDSSAAMKALAELPEMPNLVSLTIRGRFTPSDTVMRKFAASKSFPRLAELDFASTPLTTDQIAILGRGMWPLRRLMFWQMPVRKAGAEAIARAPFAETLRVLELPECQITVTGVQALAASPALSGLRHLDLHFNPVGVNGLRAIAQSEHLRGLRKLSLAHCNSSKATLDAATLLNFLSALEMPELRHLNLDSLPVGIRGARVLASGPSFANLTRLDLADCWLREKGAEAIVESATLHNLSVLDLANNSVSKSASKLANPKVFPRLARANLIGNRIPAWALGRLRKRPGVRV